MKKQIFYLASAALAMGLAACSSDELDENNGLSVKDGEFVASIQQADTEGDAATRLALSGKSLKWETGDKIGMYSTSGEENSLYQIKDGNASKGKFSWISGTKMDAATAAYAYYPYSASAGVMTKSGKIGIKLNGGTDDYITQPTETQVVNMPMVGTVSGSSITFTNTTALLQVTVVDMPANIKCATLSTEVSGLYLSGDATLNLDEKTLTMGSTAGVTTGCYQQITITKDVDTGTFETGSTVTFNFIVPVANYTNGITDTKAGTTAQDGLKFTLSSKNGTEGTGYVFQHDLNAKKNKLYTQTLYCGNEAFVTSAVQDLNVALAAAKEGAVIDSEDLSSLSEAATLYVPSVATGGTPLNQITINLNGLNAQTITLKPDKTNGITPKKVIINSNTAASVESAGSLDIQLPESSVELGACAAPVKEGEEAKEEENTATADPTVTLTTVKFKTAPNVLKVNNNVTIGTLTRDTQGNVYVSAKASVSNCTQAAYYIFKEEGATVAVASGSETAPSEVGKEIYTLLYPTATDKTSKLSKKCDLLDAITIEVAGVTIDLNGFELAAGTGKNAIIVKNGGSLEILDSSEKKEGKVSGVTGSKTIDVQEGGSVTLTSGNVEETSSAGAITVEGTLTVNGGKVTGAVAATLGGQINLAGGELASAVSVSGKNATSNVASQLTISGTGKADEAITAASGAIVEVAGGTVVKGIADDTAAATINIKGGEVKGTDAIAVTKESTVNVSGGTIKGTTSAVKVTKGTLNVTGKAALSAPDAIISNPENDGDAIINLSAEEATYVGTNSTIYNTTGQDNTKSKAVTLSITGGYFTGDIYCDVTKYFIAGGHYQNCTTVENTPAYFKTGWTLDKVTNGYWSVKNSSVDE